MTATALQRTNWAKAAVTSASSEATASRRAIGQLIIGTDSSTPSAADGSYPVAIRSTQRYFWTRVWQEGEREADADIAAGRVHRFDDADEALAWLSADAAE